MDRTYKNLGSSNHTDEERDPNDFYATDPAAIDALFEVEDFTQNIWEPAAGNGHLSKRMKELGKNVISTDIIERDYSLNIIDFLNSNDHFGGDIITNPPFNVADDFVYKALELIKDGNKVAMFLKILFLETKKRRRLFDLYPPKTIYVFSKRIGCLKAAKIDDDIKAGAMCFAWYVWEKGFNGDTILKWI